jgi:hypothetical protein
MNNVNNNSINNQNANIIPINANNIPINANNIPINANNIPINQNPNIRPEQINFVRPNYVTNDSVRASAAALNELVMDED